MKKAKSTSKLQELVANQVSNALETVKESKTTKTQVKKIKAASTDEDQVAKIPAAKAKVAKDAAIKSAKVQQEAALLEAVVSKREVKYIYPDDVQDTLARKKWRAQTRNELHRLEREMHRITDQNSKEFKAAKKAFEDFSKKVLKPNQVV